LLIFAYVVRWLCNFCACCLAHELYLSKYSIHLCDYPFDSPPCVEKLFFPHYTLEHLSNKNQW
jgi:hypothetical protein